MATSSVDDAQDSAFKWFDEGFDGFPKRLPDDCVEYTLHVVYSELQNSRSVISSLREILRASKKLKKDLLKDYIWQRQPFELKLHPSDFSESSTSSEHSWERSHPHLKGRTNFGDSIADEWLIVYILRELTRQFPEAWVRVHDTDGEFLLIEGANALPKWLNPDIAENRVWINNGHIKLIPLMDGIGPCNLCAPDAIKFIETRKEEMIVSPYLEDETFHRLSNYPAAITSTVHRASVSIPRRLAYILHRNPSYISSAVESFYLRDPISLTPLSTKDISTLNFPPEDFVTTSVKFTRVGYAQLQSQTFGPPPAWTGVIPSLKDSKVNGGMKLTCGFEMLLNDPQNRNDRMVHEIKLLLEDLENDEDTLPPDSEIASWSQQQDDEDWLNIDYNDFENELTGNKKPQRSTGKGFGDKAAHQNLKKMVSRIEQFLEDDKAGLDGFAQSEDESDDDEEEEDEHEHEDEEKGEGEEGDTDVARKHMSNNKNSKATHESAAYSEEEFKKAIDEVHKLHPDFVEKSGLLDEARKLALEDEDVEEHNDLDEDEEMKKIMEVMEQELKDYGALDLKDGKYRRKTTASSKGKSARFQTNATGTAKPVFGPEPPPNLQLALNKGKDKSEDVDDEDVGPGDIELSSDDEENEFNNVDIGLAKNMLESFKGQAGLGGPAGNLMKAMGVNLPRDENENKN